MRLGTIVCLALLVLSIGIVSSQQKEPTGIPTIPDEPEKPTTGDLTTTDASSDEITPTNEPPETPKSTIPELDLMKILVSSSTTTHSPTSIKPTTSKPPPTTTTTTLAPEPPPTTTQKPALGHETALTVQQIKPTKFPIIPDEPSETSSDETTTTDEPSETWQKSWLPTPENATILAGLVAGVLLVLELLDRVIRLAFWCLADDPKVVIHDNRTYDNRTYNNRTYYYNFYY